MVIENGSKSAHGVSADDWHLLLQTIRSLMICDETLRLYPDGHQRVRQSIKGALSMVQEYHATTRRLFTFAPELALDVSDLEGSRVAKDVITLANRLREHAIQRIAIHPEVDCDSLEALLRYLQSSPLAFEGPEAAETPEWPQIEVELFRDGADGEGYRFNAEGEQLVRASDSEASRAPVNLPPSLRKTLERVFAEPAIRESIERLQSRLGVEAPSESTADGRINLVEEVIESLFESGALVDASHEVITGKLHDFLRFIEGLAPALPATGEGAGKLTRREVRELMARAIGVQYRDQAGVAEIFEHSARLKALLSGTGSFRMQGEASGATRPAGAAPEGETKLTLRNNDAAGRARSGRPEGAATAAGASPERAGSPAERPVSQEEVWEEEEPRVSPDFSSRRAIEMYRKQVLEHLQSFDYDLEALRVRTELLAAESTRERYEKQRSTLLERLSSRKWPSAAAFNDELDQTVRALAQRESDGGVRLTGEALASHGSQEVVDDFFRRRVDGGGSIDSLRPLIRELAATDVARPAGALTCLWRNADRRSRDHLIDEVYGLFVASEPEKLAEWGRSHAAAFSSPRSLSHLRSLTPRSLEKVFREVSAPGGDGRQGSPQAAAALLDAVGGEPEHEPILVAALRRGSRAVKKKALDALDGCSSGDLLEELTKIVERENEAAKPDLDQVHLALNAMVKSPLPGARERLRRFRSERRLLRHVYRSDIRKILDLLCTMDGVSL